MSLERESLRERLMVDFVPTSFGGGAIYHRVWNEETRLTVVSIYGLVAGKVKWWCKTT